MFHQLPTPLRLLLLVAIAPSITFATPSPLIIQANTCAADGLQSCQKNLPGSFCCPEGSSCLALAGDTTVLCCPLGQSCDRIQPIICDISQQDPEKNPNAPIKTTIFDVDLEKCGAKTCCPFGYTCTSDNRCQRNKDQAQVPSASASVSSTPTAEPTESNSSTTTAESSSSPTPDKSESRSSSPKTISIIGGVIGGCLVLILVAVIAFLCIRRHRRRNHFRSEKPGFSRSGPKGNVISDPIVQSNSYRTDFILKTPSVRSSISHRAPQIEIIRSNTPRLSIPNPFNSPLPGHSPAPSSRGSVCSTDEPNARTGRVLGAKVIPIRTMKASSSYAHRLPQNTQSEPGSGGGGGGAGYENINVFADPVTVRTRSDKRYTHATTFTDLMDEADLGDVRRGRPYVPGTTPRI